MNRQPSRSLGNKINLYNIEDTMTTAKKLSSAAKAAQTVNLSTLTAKQRRIVGNIAKSSMEFGKYDHIENFLKVACQYINGVKEGRVIACVEAVAPSGMSRKVSLKMLEKYKGEKDFSLLHLNAFAALVTGDRRDKSGNLVLKGCGFDVVWDLNYRIINDLCSLGFIPKKVAANLAQKRPHDA